MMASPAAVMAALLSTLLGTGIPTANYWALTQAISPPAMIGRIIGCQNTIANLAGICAPLVTGLLVGRNRRCELSNTLAGVSLWIAAAEFLLLVRERDSHTLHYWSGAA